MWIRSYHAMEEYDTPRWTSYSLRGELLLFYYSGTLSPADRPGAGYRKDENTFIEPAWNLSYRSWRGLYLPGCQWTSCDWVDGRMTFIGLSYWLLTVPLIASLAVKSWLLGASLLRRGRRYPPGRCVNCGYDLTCKLSGICRECGRACKGSGHVHAT
jgi:hypothetical protein